MPMKNNKQTKKSNLHNQKQTIKEAHSSDNMKSEWLFDKIDRAGKFAFDTNRDDFDSKLFLEKMISYSNMTWQEIKRQTHDKSNRSKNHFISVEKMTKEAQNRITALHYEQYSDSIFSFAFQNLIRVFGIRENEHFHVLWYDPKHEVYAIDK